MKHGQLWEMKNVTNSGSSVNNQMSRARKKWWKLGENGGARIVITTEGCTDEFEEVIEAVASRGGYSEALVISDEGQMVRIKK